MTALGLFASTLTPPFTGLLDRLPTPSNRRFDKAKGPHRRDDLPHDRRVPLARQPDGFAQPAAACGGHGRRRRWDERRRGADEAITLFLAGHETTANALTWTWYLLSQNSEAQARLHAEVDAVLAGGAPGVEDLPRLRYTEMVLAGSCASSRHSLIIGRRADRASLRSGGFAVPEGSIVVASQWVTHRDPRYFPDPERFDPERWRPEAREARPKFSYFPFGGGPRVCIGESFAWMEGILLLATLAKGWRLRLLPGHAVVPSPSITLRPKHGMQMTLERRS